MRIKPGTLAALGSRLTCPPEGYGKKKELQVKHWLTSAQPVAEVGAPDITAEPSLYPNQSLDDVYKQLRDSTERLPAFFGTKAAADGSTAEEKAEEPAARLETAAAGAALFPIPVDAVAGIPAEATHPSASESQAQAALHSLHQTTAETDQSSVHSPTIPATQLLRPAKEATIVTAAVEGPCCKANNGNKPRSPLADLAAAAAAEINAISFQSPQQLLPLSSAAANLCQVLASAEAGEPVVDSNAELQQLQKQLLQLSQEHQDYVTKTCTELAAAYAEIEATKAAAAAESASSQQAIAALQQQAAAAQADAAAARSAGMQAQQEARQLKMEKEDVAAEQLEQLQQMQEQLKQTTQQNCQQHDQHHKVVQELQQQLQGSKQQLLNNRRELELTRSHAAVKESSLMSQLQAVRGQMSQLQHQCSMQQQELEQLKQDFTQQQSARCTAEAAEAKALRLAADRAQMFEALLSEVQQGSLTEYRHARLARQGQHNGKAVQQAAFAAVQQQNQQGQHSETAASSTCTSTNIGPGSTLSTGAANATAEAGPADTTEARAKQRHSLLKAAAADKKVLAQLTAARRRAEAAAQLEQSSKVQQMLNAAPEALRTLGLAFRAYVLLLEPQEDSGPAHKVTQQLSCDYQVFLDSTTALDCNKQTSAAAGSTCTPSSAAVLGVSGTLIIILPPPNQTEKAGLSSMISLREGPSACSSLASPGCMGLMHEAVRRGLPVTFVGQLAAAQQEQVSAAAKQGGWSQQEMGVLTGYLSRSCFSCSPHSAAEALETRHPADPVLNLQPILGLTDLQLSLLPQSTLKKLAAAAAGKPGVSDLLHLNCQTLTHLTLDCSAMTAAAQQALQQRQLQQQQERVAAQAGKNVQAKKLQQQPQLMQMAESIVTELICVLMRGNTTLKVLRLEGVSSTAAEVIAAAALGGRCTGPARSSKCSLRTTDSPTGCQLNLLGLNGMLVPVGALLAGAGTGSADGLDPLSSTTSSSSNNNNNNNNSGVPGLQELDLVNGNLVMSTHQTLSRPASGKTAAAAQQQWSQQVLLSEQQAVFLAVLLPHCSSLRSLQLPMLASDVAHEAAERLADAVLHLPRLKRFNGIHLDPVGAVAGNRRSGQLEQQQLHDAAIHSSLRPGISNSNQQLMLDHAGQQLGAVGAALIARVLQDRSCGDMPQVVNLTGCEIGALGAARLAASLAGLHKATQTPKDTLGDSGLQSCRRTPQPSAPPMQPAARSLTALHLSGNQLGPSGLKLLLSALAGSHPSNTGGSVLEQLEVLDVSYNNLHNDGCHMLAEYCEELKGLQVLSLAGNEISAAGAQALFGVFRQHCRTGSSNSRITTPGSSSGRGHSNLTVGQPADGAVDVCGVGQAPAARTCGNVLQKLKVLQLGCNVIGDAGLSALAAALPHLKHLQQLELQENYSIGVEGIRALAAALSSTPSLTHINLAKNSLGPQGAKLLAAGLQANAAVAAAAEETELGDTRFMGVRQLELEWCKLRTEGVVHIAAALVSATGAAGITSSGSNKCTMSSRAFSSSSSSGGGSSGSGSAVAVHCCLERLGLSRNGAGDKGVQALVEALATNSSLTHLDLRNNSIGLTGCRLLSGLLQCHNSSIRVLQLTGNMDNSSEDEAPVLQALEELAAADRSSLQCNA